MEQGKGKGSSSSSSSSSSISELFAKKESPSAGIIGTLFAPQSKVPGEVPGEHSLQPDMVAKNQEDSPNQHWNTKHGTTGEYQSAANREVKSINYQEEQRTQQPCHLSSSIYYGGQDVYAFPKSNQGSGFNSGYKDVGVDESGFASRGNWWQGSLYY